MKTRRKTTRNLEELTLVFEREFRRRGDEWLIACCRRPGDGEFDDTVHVKTTARRGELEYQGEYRFLGYWSDNGYGKTFVARSWVPALPSGRDGVVYCLAQAPGIGPTIAVRLWEVFGADAVHTLIDNPELAAQSVVRFSLGAAIAAADYLRARRATIDAYIDLLDLLGKRGFPRRMFDEVLAEWGNRGPQLIRKNPFLLSRFSGAGFKRCDDLWLDLGLNPRRLKRQTLCLSYAISRDSSGDTWHTPQRCERILRETLSGATPNAPRAVKLGARAGLFSVHRDADCQLWITLRRHDRDEQTIAGKLRRARSETPQWPAVDGPHFADLSEHQRDVLRSALTSTVAILCGSPGVGKTYTAARLLRAIADLDGEDAIALCSPTGKASRRLTEMARGVGLGLVASTVHSLLGPRGVDDDVWQFAHGVETPLPCSWIVCDETSMLDGQIAAALLSARDAGAHILFVGDPDQLPSVGPGNVLADLIAAGVACGRLDEIHRNSGAIVKACRAIRCDERFETFGKMRLDAGENLVHKPTPYTKAAMREVVELAKKLVERRHVDEERFQVLCATNDVRRQLNRELREIFNPATAGAPADDTDYRPGDKVICLRNARRPGVDGGEHYVCNGELGVVHQAHPNRTEVIFRDPFREVLFFDGDDLTLAYAITTHKAQGSEWDYVAVLLEDSYGAKMCTDRGWLYTALSRAKRGCFLIGPRSVADGMCRRLSVRKTFLQERIRDDHS